MTGSQNESDEPTTLVHAGDSIMGDHIYVQARDIKKRSKPRAWSGSHQIQSADCKKTAQAWITKELRYVRDQE